MLFTRLVKIHQPIFLRSAQSIIEKLNYKRWILGLGREGRRTPSVISLCEMPVPLFVAWRERVLLGRTLSVAYGDSSPEGRALGKEGRFRPHSLTAGRSQLLSCKLPAPAKASPFRERWHGEAVTERVDPSFGPAEHPSCSVKLRSCKKQERSTSRPRQNHNGRSTFGVSPCQRETILLKRKRTPYSTKWRRRLIIHPKMNKKIWFMFTKKRLWYDILQAMALFC